MAGSHRAARAASHRTSAVKRRTRFPHLRVGNRVHFQGRLSEAQLVCARGMRFASEFDDCAISQICRPSVDGLGRSLIESQRLSTRTRLVTDPPGLVVLAVGVRGKPSDRLTCAPRVGDGGMVAERAKVWPRLPYPSVCWNS